MKFSTVLFILPFILSFKLLLAKTNSRAVNVIEDVNDMKELKKVFRTKNNVLVLFVSGQRDAQPQIKVFREASEAIKGHGTMVLLDCGNSEVKKLCKKLKVSPSPYLMKHYKDGDFHKDFDRQVSVPSISNFMRDPTGDLPWDEDPTGADVLHLSDAASLQKLLKKESRSIMVMFYAPWCGFCKQMKPDYSEVAKELHKDYVIAAMDVNKPENSIVRKQFNITGFPTILYFEDGKLRFPYEGENNKAAIISFMQNPTPPPLIKPKESDWAAEANSEIVHLSSVSFDPALKDEKSALVMFYAPWCGHCKKMKPEFEKAAEKMRKEHIPGILAGLDATKDGPIAAKFGVKGYPTVKFFSYGEFKFDVNVRDADKIISFMKNPQEPPPPPPPETPWEEEESDVVHLNDENFKSFLKKKKHVLVMFYAPWCGHCKRTKPEFQTAASNFRDDPRVELAAIDCTQHSAVCGVYEVRGYPTFKYFNFLKTVSDYNGGRTEKDFIKFLNDPNAPSPTPEKTEPEGFGKQHPGSENVLDLKDNNFDEQIQLEKRALVMFYAPWCGHCKTMKPAYAEAATRVVKENLGKLIAVDSTVNRAVTEKFNIQGYPTLKYFENGKLKSEYNGARTSEGLYSFMKSGGPSKDEL